MNKLGIKVYPDSVYYIGNKHWIINSIKYHTAISIFKFRIINELQFGIKLYKTYKKR